MYDMVIAMYAQCIAHTIKCEHACSEGDELFVRHSWTPLVHSWGGCLFVTKMLKEGEEIRREEKEREKKMKCNKCISKYDELFLLKA